MTLEEKIFQKSVKRTDTGLQTFLSLQITKEGILLSSMLKIFSFLFSYFFALKIPQGPNQTHLF